MRKAVDIEPRNVEYKFSLAVILARTRMIEESNRILNDIAANTEISFAECYFAMGCNYFDMHDFLKAKQSFEKYIEINPHGEFTVDARHILYYLEIYQKIISREDEIRTIRIMSKHGIEMFNRGDLNKSAEIFGKIIKQSPHAVAPRNNLSLVYFYKDEIEKAISVSESVLAQESNNVHANCNLLLFYKNAGNNALYNNQLGKICRINPQNDDEFYKVLDTFVRTDEHFCIYRLLIPRVKAEKQLVLYHLLATSLFNMMQFSHAYKVWDSMLQAYLCCTDSIKQYADIAMKAEHKLKRFKKLDYVVDILDRQGIDTKQIASQYILLDDVSKQKIYTPKYKNSK